MPFISQTPQAARLPGNYSYLTYVVCCNEPTQAQTLFDFVAQRDREQMVVFGSNASGDRETLTQIRAELLSDDNDDEETPTLNPEPTLPPGRMTYAQMTAHRPAAVRPAATPERPESPDRLRQNLLLQRDELQNQRADLQDRMATAQDEYDAEELSEVEYEEQNVNLNARYRELGRQLVMVNTQLRNLR